MGLILQAQILLLMIPPPGLTITTTYTRWAKDNTCSTTFIQSTGSWIVNVTPNNSFGPASSNPTLCVNTILTAITLSTTTATGIGAAISLPTGVSAAWATNTITITGTPTVAGVFNYSIPLLGGCGNVNATGTITIKALPTAPTIGNITQPTCTTSTGSVVLNGLPSGSWTLNPGNIPGSGTSTTISPLAPGTTDFTVTDVVSGCTSLQTQVIISSGNSKRWLGTTSTDWFTDSNWLPTGVPDANTCVLVPTNVVTLYISGTNKTAFANTLTIADGGKLEVNSGNTLVVTNIVTVDTGGTLKLQNSANLIQINNSINTGTINVLRDTAPIILNDYTYWSSPTSGSQTLLEFSPNTNPKYFLTFSNGWQFLNASTAVFEKGIGYAILAPKVISASAPSSITFQFNGTPNNGIVPVSVTPGSNSALSTKLIGNPYPSALDADKFILANRVGLGTLSQTISGTLYFWTHNQPLSAGTYPQSDYAAYNLTGGIGTGIGTTSTTGTGNSTKPTRWIASGQGFEVETKANGNVTFTNDMRTIDINYINNNFYKNVNNANIENGFEKNRIWLNLTDDKNFSQTLIGYVETATNDYDPGFDGAYIRIGKNGFYSLIGNKIFTIQGRALPLTTSDVVPLGYKTESKGNLTISIDSIDGLFAGNQDIFIEDKLLNTIHNLKAAPYTFATKKGTFNDRFVLRYSKTNLGLNDPNNISSNVIISSKNEQIKIQSTVENIAKVFIYDMLGKTIYKNLEIDQRQILISDLKTQQVLIIKIILNNGRIVTEKLVNQ